MRRRKWNVSITDGAPSFRGVAWCSLAMHCECKDRFEETEHVLFIAVSEESVRIFCFRDRAQNDAMEIFETILESIQSGTVSALKCWDVVQEPM